MQPKKKDKDTPVAGTQLKTTFNFVEFTEPGQIVTGVFKGTVEGPFGAVIQMVDPDSGEEFDLPSNVVLMQAISQMVEGKKYTVEFTGERQTRGRNRVKTFDIYQM